MRDTRRFLAGKSKQPLLPQHLDATIANAKEGLCDDGVFRDYPQDFVNQMQLPDFAEDQIRTIDVRLEPVANKNARYPGNHVRGLPVRVIKFAKNNSRVKVIALRNKVGWARIDTLYTDMHAL